MTVSLATRKKRERKAAKQELPLSYPGFLKVAIALSGSGADFDDRLYAEVEIDGRYTRAQYRRLVQALDPILRHNGNIVESGRTRQGKRCRRVWARFNQDPKWGDSGEDLLMRLERARWIIVDESVLG